MRPTRVDDIDPPLVGPSFFSDPYNGFRRSCTSHLMTRFRYWHRAFLHLAVQVFKVMRLTAVLF